MEVKIASWWELKVKACDPGKQSMKGKELAAWLACPSSQARPYTRCGPGMPGVVCPYLRRAQHLPAQLLGLATRWQNNTKQNKKSGQKNHKKAKSPDSLPSWGMRSRGKSDQQRIQGCKWATKNEHGGLVAFPKFYTGWKKGLMEMAAFCGGDAPGGQAEASCVPSGSWPGLPQAGSGKGEELGRASHVLMPLLGRGIGGRGVTRAGGWGRNSPAPTAEPRCRLQTNRGHPSVLHCNPKEPARSPLGVSAQPGHRGVERCAGERQPAARQGQHSESSWRTDICLVCFPAAADASPPRENVQEFKTSSLEEFHLEGGYDARCGHGRLLGRD